LMRRSKDWRYSITSSARSKISRGSVRPMAFAATTVRHSTAALRDFNLTYVCFGSNRGHGLECLLLSTCENDFRRGSLSRRPILLFKNEAAARAYGKRIEDTFVSLARNRAGLATFSIDETNDSSTWGT